MDASDIVKESDPVVPVDRRREVLERNILRLSAELTEGISLPRAGKELPSHAELARVVELVKSIIFPGFFDDHHFSRGMLVHHVGVNLDVLCRLLQRQIMLGERFIVNPKTHCDRDCAESLTLDFIDALPEIKRLLYTDVDAVYRNDPAARGHSEVLFSYPSVDAMIHYRIAHRLHEEGVPVLPRMLTEMAHSRTGIDIHPGATIGAHFAIDHGTGVVIGETCRIGDRVTIYQGVTLGAKNFTTDEEGRPVNLPRHPIIEDDVTIYSNASVLGRITIGRGSVIGGNVWLTHSVPPGSRIFQRKAVPATFSDGAGI